MKKYALLSAGLLFAGSAYAANMPAPPPAAPPPTPNWDGFYIGANGGGMWGKTKTDLSLWSDSMPSFLATSPAGLQSVVGELQTTSNQRFSNSGGVFGGHVGYMMHTTLIPPLQPVGGLILGGLEVGLDWMNVKGSVNSSMNSVVNPGLAFGFDEAFKSDFLLTAMERGGPLLGNWFPYITAGFALAKFHYTSTYSDNGGGTAPNVSATVPSTASLSGIGLGGGVGGGLEWRWTRNWSVRGQFVYYYFEGAVEGNSTVFSPTTGGAAMFRHQVGFSEGIATGAINYRF